MTEDATASTVLGSVYFDGAWHRLDRGRCHPLINPASEEQVGTLQCADINTVNDVVQAAERASAYWASSQVAERRDALERITAGIEARAEDFAWAISTEIGAPIDFARSAQVKAATGHLRATLGALDRSKNDVILGDDPMHRVRYEALGVAALITPWNWPLNQVVLKLGAALAAGCSTVLKPSEYSTRTAVLLTEVVAEAGLPNGVFNLLIGDGQTGADLVAHRHVDVISFTGSTQVGRDVARQAAGRFTRTAMELGGKSPNLLFADCDMETALRQGLAHCFRNAGQSCNAASRMLVERPIYARAVALAAQIASETQLGQPGAPGSHLGPLINRNQFAHVNRLIEQGLSSDARLVAGGAGRAPGFAKGFFVQPTVFSDVARDNPLFQKEIFGPVLTMTPFDEEDEAIDLANATAYGLAAYVQTSCPLRADRVSRKLHAGMVQVNGTSRASGAPFGGVKASGHGREAGIWGIRTFQDVKSISGAAAVSE